LSSQRRYNDGDCGCREQPSVRRRAEPSLAELGDDVDRPDEVLVELLEGFGGDPVLESATADLLDLTIVQEGLASHMTNRKPQTAGSV
jgi:hypothetical protein